jgi:type III restriction enzyme
VKLHFEPNLDYQLQAVEAVCDLFRGQEICRTEFTVTMPTTKDMQIPGMESDLGIGNRLTLLDDDLLKSLHDIQLRNGLPPSGTLASGDFTVEMETGTGKTYVYLRTIFELNKLTASGVRRKESVVVDGDNLEMVTSQAIYADCSIGEIRVEKGKEFMELRFPGGEQFLKPGEAYGDVDALAVQRQMIRRTIREHLDKELRLRPQGIKVLSLFFIDEVAKYRSYDAEGNSVKGGYARIFEEEYARAAKLPDYLTLFSEVDLTHAAEEVHNGYFSIDKKGGWTNTEENNQGNRESAERAYNLIMKEKEKLLSLETPLKFIFSHSALKEGWDNPNVFQICALREMGSERERRQTIGRGLRLCVNQHGLRLRGFEVNTLTVIATESYEQFAENLQREIEAETGIRFGIVEEHQFAAISVTTDEGISVPLGFEQSKLLWEHLKKQNYIDSKGKVQDSLKRVLKEGTLVVPEPFSAQLDQITAVLKKLAGRLEIKNADDRRQVLTRQAVLHSPEFKELWERIKHKTTYRVEFATMKSWWRAASRPYRMLRPF